MLFSCSLLFLLSSVTSYQFLVTNDDQLERFLCNSSPLTEDTIVVLSANITHIIDNVSFCIINTTYSLTLTSDSLLSAVVHCNGSILQPTTGFAFINVHNLTLQRLVWSGCGGYLRGSTMKFVNSTNFYFTWHHLAVLLFSRVNNLLIKNLNITSYYGFALLAINPFHASIDNVSISTLSARRDNYFGSGILLLFSDGTGTTELSSVTVTINNSDIYGNSETYSRNAKCLSEFPEIKKHGPVINAAGITVLYTQQNYSANVVITNSNFCNNIGHLVAGAILILHYDTEASIHTEISRSFFTKNLIIDRCPGVSLSFFEYFSETSYNFGNESSLEQLLVKKCTFEKHGWAGFLNIGINTVMFLGSHNPPNNNKSTNFIFTDVIFIYNVAIGSSCIYAETYNRDSKNRRIQIVLRNVIASFNIQYQYLGTGDQQYRYSIFPVIKNSGVFTVSNINKIFIERSGNFSNNFGSVFNITNTDVVLDGKLNFERNIGEIGSVFVLQGSSVMYLADGLKAKFINNKAVTHGGAIYGYDYRCLYKRKEKCLCMIQTKDFNSNITMYFDNNIATESGSAIISTNIYNCYIDGNFYNASAAANYLNKISDGTLDNGLSTFSTKLCTCDKGHCITFTERITVYAGQTLHIPITALDDIGQKAYSEVSVGLFQKRTISFARTKKFFVPIFSWYVSNSKKVIISHKKCSIVFVTLFKRKDDDGLGNKYLVVTGRQGYTVQSQQLKLPIDLEEDCPIGFQFDTEMGICKCSPILNNLAYIPFCKITLHLNRNSFPVISISKPSNFITVWIGLISNGTNSSYFGVASSCYIYCNFNPMYTTFIVNGSEIILANSSNTSDSISICIDNREGPLCSQCITGYSAVFGSSECKQCSNWWLLTIIVYAAAGPLLIYLLYALKLTLTTGTINSFIFYGQVLAIVANPELHHSYFFNFILLSKSLVALFNLSFYYPLCFYDGMSELMKSGIGLAFPFYLLIIVIGLIIASRYSVKLSNRLSHSSVQVLVTIVHLSFSRLLTSVLITFSSVKIHTNTTETPLLVWEYDATIEYGKGGHLILVIITSVMVGPLLCVYMIVLLGGRLLLKINMLREYLRPVYEAIHAPYKTNKEFCFTAQVLLVLFVYILYDQLRDWHHFLFLYILMAVLISYCVINVYFAPLKAAWLNILNLFLLLIILLRSLTVWYLLHYEDSEKLIILIFIFNLIFLLMFMGILCIHILWVRGKLVNFFIPFNKRSNHSVNTQRRCSRNNNSYGSFSDFREPLLSP